MTQIKVGCDPEVFVMQHGVFLSAHNLIPGDKKNPHKVDKGAVQVDGMALEFNIDPATSEDEFCINVETVFNTLKLMVPDYQIATVPVAHFDPAYMERQPAEALELGCDPDFNGWNGQANDKPNGNRPFRTASGHVHIGWTEGEDIDSHMHYMRCCNVAQQMDFFLGLPSLVYDKDTLRRELYGKAGCFRPKSYGAEYRTLSNAWLTDRKLMAWVFRNVQEGMKRIMSGDLLAERHGDISEIINKSDWESAKKILIAENIEVPA